MQRRHICSPAASFANCVMTLLLLLILILLLLLLLLLALQPAVGFGLSNNTAPFFPVLHQLSPSSHAQHFNPLNPELNPICYLLALLGAHHFLHVSRIRVKSLTLKLLMSYIYIYIYMEHQLLMFLDHTQRRSTVGRTPMDE